MSLPPWEQIHKDTCAVPKAFNANDPRCTCGLREQYTAQADERSPTDEELNAIEHGYSELHDRGAALLLLGEVRNLRSEVGALRRALCPKCDPDKKLGLRYCHEHDE